MLCLCCVLQAEQLSKEMDELTSVSGRKKSIALAQAKPTIVLPANTERLSLAESTARLRHKKTISAAKITHGATVDDDQPAIHGLWHAFVHLASDSQMEYLFQGSKKAMVVIAQLMQNAK